MTTPTLVPPEVPDPDDTLVGEPLVPGDDGVVVVNPRAASGTTSSEETPRCSSSGTVEVGSHSRS